MKKDLKLQLKFNYIDKEKYSKLISKSEEVGKLLNYMINNPEKFN